MTDLDLTEAIEAAAKAFVDHDRFCPAHDDVADDAPIYRCAAGAAVRAAAPIIERAVREQAEAKIKYLTDEVAFWKDQKLAANVAATIADLDEVAPALRQLLAAERKRCRRAEDEVDRLLRLIPADAGEAK